MENNNNNNNNNKVPVDIVTARAAYRERMRWLHCECCLLTGPDVLHDVDGVVLCIRCRLELAAVYNPEMVVRASKIVAQMARKAAA